MALLSNIVASYILKDVRSLIREENVRAFNSMLVFLAQNQGQIISAASLAREVRLSEPTIAAHLDILEHTYACSPVHSYSSNLGNELKKSKKYYLFDHGIRNLLLKDFSSVSDRADSGCLLEAHVFHSLSRKLQPNEELRFWRTRGGNEVAFVFVRDQHPFPIEVKSVWDHSFPPEGMAAFFKVYPRATKGWIFTSAGAERYFNWEGRTLRFVPAENAELIELS